MKPLKLNASKPSVAPPPGNFDLVGTVFYEIDQQPYQTVFYNGTIEVAESGGFFSVELVFLATFGVSLLVLLDLWVQGRVQSLSKGIAYTQSLSRKWKKKK